MVVMVEPTFSKKERWTLCARTPNPKSDSIQFLKCNTAGNVPAVSFIPCAIPATHQQSRCFQVHGEKTPHRTPKPSIEPPPISPTTAAIARQSTFAPFRPLCRSRVSSFPRFFTAAVALSPTEPATHHRTPPATRQRPTTNPRRPC